MRASTLCSFSNRSRHLPIYLVMIVTVFLTGSNFKLMEEIGIQFLILLNQWMIRVGIVNHVDKRDNRLVRDIGAIQVVCKRYLRFSSVNFFWIFVRSNWRIGWFWFWVFTIITCHRLFPKTKQQPKHSKT